MPWFESDFDTGLAKKLARAAAYYGNKYGEMPNLCFTHPGTLDCNTESNGDDLELRTCSFILPNYFWIGLDQEILEKKEKK